MAESGPYQETHQFTEVEDTTRIVVFRVKSRGVLFPEIMKSEKELCNFNSEDLASDAEAVRRSLATNPFKALSWENKYSNFLQRN